MAIAKWGSSMFSRRSPDGITIQSLETHPGQIWYVDSTNGSNTLGHGQNPEARALASLAYLITNAAALGVAAGDEVILCPTHNENIGDAQIILATVGLRVRGLEDPVTRQRPRLDFDHANASVQITANAVILDGIDFLPSITAVLIGVDIQTGATDCMIRNCRFLAGEDGAGADEFVKAIRLQSGNHYTHIVDTLITNHDTAAQSTHAIHVDAASNYCVYDNVVISGPWATAGLLEDAAGLEVTFQNCSIDVTGQQASFHANSTYAVWRNNWLKGQLDSGVQLEQSGLGAVYYVDSTSGHANNSGFSWGSALATLNQAVDKCTNNYGNTIYVAAEHAETIGGAAAIDLDVSGVRIIGLGSGGNRPTFTFDTNTDTIEINAADVTLENLRFVSDVADLASAIDITASGDGAVIRGCEFRAGAANKEMLIALDVEAAADRLTIEDNEFYTVATGDDTHGISLAGESVNTVIRRNIFVGEWDTAAIDGATAAQTDISIVDNFINNGDAGAGLAIGLHNNSTGTVARNICFGGLTSVNPILAQGCHQAGNKVATVPGLDIDGELGIRCVRASSTIAQTGQLDKFTIAGGRVMVTSIVGEVDTANIGAVASNLKLTYNPTAGISQDMCAVLAHANDTIGTLYSITGVPTDALQRCGLVMSTPMILDAGAIEEDCSANNTGQIQWTCWWYPIDAGATLVAA